MNQLLTLSVMFRYKVLSRYVRFVRSSLTSNVLCVFVSMKNIMFIFRTENR